MTITCPKCHKEIPIPDDKPSTVKCPHCKATLAIKYRGDESSNEPEQTEKTSFGTKVKNIWREHKGKIIAGTVAVVTVVVGAIVIHRTIKDSSVDSDADSDLLPPSNPEPPTTPPDPYDLAVDPWATDDDDEFPEDDLSDLEYSSFLQEKCPRCGTPLYYGFYTVPWEDGDNEYGYWTCSHCGKIIYDWASGDDD